MFSAGIVGHGIVGKGMHNLLNEYVRAIYDPAVPRFVTVDSPVVSLKESGPVWNDKDAFRDLDLSIICVPTNENPDGSCNTSIVEESLSWLNRIGFNGVSLIKSTTSPSELLRFKKKFKKLRIVFSPEMLGESKYFTPYWKYPDPTDARKHTWQVFGGDRKDTEVCVEVFKRKMSVDTQFFQTDIATASLAKYIENSFFAAKVTFVNEWYDIAKTYGVDWNELRELWLSDPRINRNHTLVFPKDRGYGGKCYPKDIKAIIYDSTKQGYTPELMTAVDKINKKFRKK